MSARKLTLRLKGTTFTYFHVILPVLETRENAAVVHRYVVSPAKAGSESFWGRTCGTTEVVPCYRATARRSSPVTKRLACRHD